MNELNTMGGIEPTKNVHDFAGFYGIIITLPGVVASNPPSKKRMPSIGQIYEIFDREHRF